MGELSEIFQWRGEVPRGLPGWSPAEREHLGEELSDVLLYLVRLADVCGVDIGGAVLRKLEKNAQKYPAAKCRWAVCTGQMIAVNFSSCRIEHVTVFLCEKVVGRGHQQQRAGGQFMKGRIAMNQGWSVLDIVSLMGLSSKQARSQCSADCAEWV